MSPLDGVIIWIAGAVAGGLVGYGLGLRVAMRSLDAIITDYRKIAMDALSLVKHDRDDRDD